MANGNGNAMIHEIMEDLRHIRRRLDDHIDDEKNTLDRVQRDVSNIREDMAGHKTRLALVSGAIAFAVTAMVSWALTKV